MDKILSFFPGLPVQLLAVVVGVTLFGHSLSQDLQQCLYALSLTIKELLLFSLPLIVFSYVASCLTSFQHGQVRFIVFLLIAICMSNLASTWVAYSASHLAIDHIMIQPMNPSSDDLGHVLSPAWAFSLPPIISNNIALTTAFIVGLMYSWHPISALKTTTDFLKSVATFILQRLFIPIVPVFVLGFMVKLHHDGSLVHMLHDYSRVVAIVVATQISYILILYGIGARFQYKRWITFLHNAFPAALTGLTTMSSIAAMPVAIQGAEKNTNSPLIARAILPIAVNIHLIGDSIGIPIIAIALLSSFGYPWPDLTTFFLFSIQFVIAKFAVAAVPGGGIVVMLPILQHYLGFTPEMLSLMMALYILFDSIMTSMNTLGNGAFTILLTQSLGARFRNQLNTSQSPTLQTE